jgi:cellulose synthase/poly-beta-1,6-N-acetylglucosamine synthase-like glycosyltransferase
MLNSFDIIYTSLLFVAIYIQVFFLLIFFEGKNAVKKNNKPEVEIRDEDYLSVTFLIPCWNEQDSVVNTLDSVLGLDYPKDKFHIIAIDDGSTDDTWKNLQAYENHPQVMLLTKENGGKHSALNHALNFLKTELVASFDADTKINPDALKKATAYFMHDEKLMALGGTVLIDGPKTMAQKAQEIEYEIFSFTKKMLGMADAVFVVPGAFSIFRREVFDIVGGYKNAHNLEDIELTMRIQKHGLRVSHAHDAIVWTKGPDTVKKLYKQRLRWSYGFIMNMLDYKAMLFNRKYKNFGIFTLPMTVFTYVLLLFVFSYSVYKVILSAIETIYKIYLVGIGQLEWPAFDAFFINTKIYVIMAMFLYISVVLQYMFGREISKISKKNFWNIPYFLLMFSVLAPVWVLKSIYNVVARKKVMWR